MNSPPPSKTFRPGFFFLFPPSNYSIKRFRIQFPGPLYLTLEYFCQFTHSPSLRLRLTGLTWSGLLKSDGWSCFSVVRPQSTVTRSLPMALVPCSSPVHFQTLAALAKSSPNIESPHPLYCGEIDRSPDIKALLTTFFVNSLRISPRLQPAIGHQPLTRCFRWASPPDPAFFFLLAACAASAIIVVDALRTLFGFPLAAPL